MDNSAFELIEQARLARADGRPDDALRHVEQAIAQCRAIGDQPGLIVSIKALGHLEADRKDFQASAAAYREALALARGAADPLVLAHTVRHLGDALSRLGETHDAEAAYAEAIALYQQNVENSQADHANALRSYARFMDATSRPDEAVLLWTRARDFYASAGVRQGIEECAARLDT